MLTDQQIADAWKRAYPSRATEQVPFYFANELLRTPEPTPRPVHVGWICKDDLERLLQTGAAMVYEVRQEFRLLPDKEQYRVLIEAPSGVLGDGRG